MWHRSSAISSRLFVRCFTQPLTRIPECVSRLQVPFGQARDPMRASRYWCVESSLPLTAAPSQDLVAFEAQYLAGSLLVNTSTSSVRKIQHDSGPVRSLLLHAVALSCAPSRRLFRRTKNAAAAHPQLRTEDSQLSGVAGPSVCPRNARAPVCVIGHRQTLAGRTIIAKAGLCDNVGLLL